MRNWLFIVKVYLLALVCFLPVGVAYTFYKKNFGKQPVHVKDFPRIEILNHLGEYKTIDDYKGNTLLVNFWFADCPFSLDEMKYFPELLDRYDDLTIMSFSIDSASVTREVLKNKVDPWNFIVTENPQWTFYNVDREEKGGYVELLNVNSFPTYFLINKQGEIISSPRNAIFAIEQELSGIFSLRSSYLNYMDKFGVQDVEKAVVTFHLMVTVLFLVLFFVRKYSKKYSGDNYQYSLKNDEHQRDSLN